MKLKPLRNALLAIGYIALVVLCITQFIDGPAEHSAPILMPMLMLSLLTLSVAVMGYLFFYEPLKMYIDGDKKGAMQLFLRTIGIFAIIPAILFLLIALSF
jgi:hypothetical protein